MAVATKRNPTNFVTRLRYKNVVAPHGGGKMNGAIVHRRMTPIGTMLRPIGGRVMNGPLL